MVVAVVPNSTHRVNEYGIVTLQLYDFNNFVLIGYKL